MRFFSSDISKSYTRVVRHLVLAFLLMTMLSGCAIFLEILGVEEVATLGLRGAGVLRSAVRTGAVRYTARGAVVIADEMTAFSELSRVRISRRVLGNARLTITTEAGSELEFAEALNEYTIRNIKTGRIFQFPNGRLYRTINGKANVRTGWGTEYDVFIQLSRDRLVLVVDRVGQWYQIQISANQYGWMYASLLAPISVSEKDRSVICDKCNGSGLLNGCYCSNGKQRCEWCHGRGNVNCSSCRGYGIGYVCYICKGIGNFRCDGCEGSGSIYCPVCHGTRGIMYEHHRYDCLNCKIQGVVVCPKCNGVDSRYDCDACQGKKYTPCVDCSGSGKVKCGECKRGLMTCENCNGRLQRKCDSCNGIGIRRS